MAAAVAAAADDVDGVDVVDVGDDYEKRVGRLAVV